MKKKMNLLRKLSLYVALWLLITPLLLAFPGFTIAQTKIAFSTERHICHRACLVIPPHRLRHGKIDRDVRGFQPLRQLRGRQPSVRFLHDTLNLMPLFFRKCAMSLPIAPYPISAIFIVYSKFIRFINSTNRGSERRLSHFGSTFRKTIRASL